METGLYRPLGVAFASCRIWSVLCKYLKIQDIKNSKVLYFTYLSRSSPWTNLHQIWHRVSFPRLNHMCQIFISIGLGVSILYGVKICHSPLTKPVAVNTVQSLLPCLWQDIILKRLLIGTDSEDTFIILFTNCTTSRTERKLGLVLSLIVVGYYRAVITQILVPYSNTNFMMFR